MLNKLKQLGARQVILEWVESRKDLTPQQLWDKCPNGSWLLWLLAKTQADHKKIVLCAARCARLSLQYNPDPRVVAAVETAEAFAQDKATVEDCSKAAIQADEAMAAVDNIVYLPTSFTVVNNCCRAAYTAHASAAAAFAAHASAAAAFAASSAASAAAAAAFAADDARQGTLKQCADIVREVFPNVPVL